MRFYALDLFRFYAALAVVLYHYTARLGSDSFPLVSSVTQFGYLGVPFFFMISGFVISASAEKGKPIEFLIARAGRLYPAYWIGVSFTALMVIFFSTDTVSPREYLANLTMLNNYLGIEDLDAVYWTLHAELKFYGCIFLLLCFNLFRYYLAWLSIWAVITLTFLLFEQPFFMGWFISPFYSPFFISGVVFYVIWKQGPKPGLLAILSLSTMLACIRAYEQAPQFMTITSSYQLIVAPLWIMVFHALFGLLAAGRLQLRAAWIYVALGGMTYPLYLIHNKAGKSLIDAYTPQLGEGFMVSITIILMLLLSYLIYAYLEQPLARGFKTLLRTMVSPTKSLVRSR